MTAVITGVVALVIFINKCSLMLPTFLTLSQRILKYKDNEVKWKLIVQYMAPLFTINRRDYF
jgi:hypothetical protein